MSCTNEIPQPKKKKTDEKYPSFIPCTYCGFDLWQLLNYRLVSKALSDDPFDKKKKCQEGLVDYDMSAESDSGSDPMETGQ